ncbi:MAG: amidohydrolase [Candidatus Aminicenantes bacterium]|nr:amidohydrolase [Candidatus Aminicenantes bacterium]
MKNKIKIIRYIVILFIAGVCLLNNIQAYPALGMNNSFLDKLKQDAVKFIDLSQERLISVSDAVWEFAEIALLEYKSSQLLADLLEEEGFRVERGVAKLPTAFVASFGSGHPIIGILAEYDALPGLSQAALPFKDSLLEGGAGHGCGHNLFAAGSLGAALAVKEIIQKNSLEGTVRLYGCPAEEDVGGKLYMARDGLFDDLDACLAWHPDYETRVDITGSQAVDDLEIEFFGKAAHAAFDPWKGASALDAVEMTVFGINLLREHVKPSVRMHYVITNGGKVPNIVPDNARLWLWVRDSDRQGVKDVVRRVEKIVEGTAIATATTSKIHYEGSYHEMLVNITGSRAMQKNLEMIGPVKYTEEEADYAKKIQRETGNEENGLVTVITEWDEAKQEAEGGSTDVAEVSWITPTLHVSTTCAPYGIPWHSWAVVSSSKHAIGYKGMLLAAKVLAVTALDCLLDEELLSSMKTEFIEKLNGYKYKCGIPEGQDPPIPEIKNKKKY